jgi:uncharacterized protein (DUF2236 family)
MATTAYAPVPDTLPLSRRSVSWKVLAEPVAFFGGGRAVLLQVAHPKVGAGVEQHSTYATDPWARLFRTVDVMAKLSFAPLAVSAQQARLLEAMHQRVTGATDDGEPYAALDPALLVWVWATLVETGLLMYERVFPALTLAERDQYYEEWKLVAYGCGVPRGGCPTSWDDFESYVARTVDEELRATPAARSVAHATMVPPLPWPLNRLSAGPQQLVTIGTFPPSLRDGFGFVWDGGRDRRLRWFFGATTFVMRLTPRYLRQAGFRYVVRRDEPLQFPWLQRRGAALTARRMATFESPTSADRARQ